MKKITFVMLLLLLPALTMAETVTVTVKGMVCSFCAQGIKKTFRKQDVIQDVSVDLDKKLVVLKTKAGRKIEDLEIRSLINDAGYDVESIERDKP